MVVFFSPARCKQACLGKMRRGELSSHEPSSRNVTPDFWFWRSISTPVKHIPSLPLALGVSSGPGVGLVSFISTVGLIQTLEKQDLVTD